MKFMKELGKWSGHSYARTNDAHRSDQLQHRYALRILPRHCLKLLRQSLMACDFNKHNIGTGDDVSGRRTLGVSPILHVPGAQIGTMLSRRLGAAHMCRWCFSRGKRFSSIGAKTWSISAAKGSNCSRPYQAVAQPGVPGAGLCARDTSGRCSTRKDAPREQTLAGCRAEHGAFEMSRYYRKAPIIGMTTADSDKRFKAAKHRRERRKLKETDLTSETPATQRHSATHGLVKPGAVHQIEARWQNRISAWKQAHFAAR